MSFLDSMSPQMAADLARPLYEENARLRQQVTLIHASMLTGEGGALFGKPVRIRLEWPEGLPAGMTEGDLRRMGSDMRDRALRDETGSRP